MEEKFDVNDLKRTDLIYNTLNECVIRIDFIKINNIDKILENLSDVMKEYELKSNEVFNIDLEIHDPKTLITQELIKNNVNKSVNWEYYTPTEKFIVNEYVLIFVKKIFNNYAGIEKYQTTLEKMLKIIIEEEKELKISRVGLRKKNVIFTKDFYDWKNILNEEYVPKKYDNKLDEINISSKILNKEKDNYSYNNYISVKKGMAKKDNENIKVNRIICDIDFYKRIIEDKNNLNLSDYNDNIFNMYKNMLNKNFVKKLRDGDIKEDAIVWGINKNDRTK